MNFGEIPTFRRNKPFTGFLALDTEIGEIFKGKVGLSPNYKALQPENSSLYYHFLYIS
jgi:hypothetical protein